MQNVQMMRVEPCEEDPSINMVLRTTTSEDKGKLTEVGLEVRKTPTMSLYLVPICA